MVHTIVKFIYSEKATKFYKIFTLLLSIFTVGKSKEQISQNFKAFSEHTNFTFIIEYIIHQGPPASAITDTISFFFQKEYWRLEYFEQTVIDLWKSSKWLDHGPNGSPHPGREW